MDPVKLKNGEIVDAINAIGALQAIEIKDLKTNYNLARSLKYLRAAHEKYENERIALVESMFGQEKADENHKNWKEWQKNFNKLLQEETAVEKIFRVTLEGLDTKGSKAVPSSVLEAISFLIENFEQEPVQVS